MMMDNSVSSSNNVNRHYLQSVFNCPIVSDSGKNTLNSYLLTTSLDQVRIHPAILRLGMRMKERLVIGTNERSRSLLVAIGQMLEDYFCPAYKNIEKHIKIVLDTHITYITSQRQHNIAMGNVIKWLKKQINSINPSLETGVIISQLINNIKSYIDRRIIISCERISQIVSNEYISNGDVIIIYSFSSAVSKSLYNSAKLGKKFQLIVIDSKNNLDTNCQKLTKKLSLLGIKITYTLLNSLSYHLKYANKILLGSCAVFSNGYVMNRSGSALVALLGKTHHIPVLVLTESYKLCERNYIQYSTTFNEIVEQPLVNISGNTVSSVISCYDVIPPNFISAIITEDGIHSTTAFALQLNKDSH
ncbi:initiation factor 2 subunit family protein [Cryptosporidium muris RN66]|uniref:Translation initiation factor eIF2B subunit delta n=1 Tax=Cryptosporidium muris (strain RN66) TaxID=441375 RepID=B6AG26_CRYMR|nr:initiation factor 2 subunit family protein [Cryptosporidium muris RN66]EEA07167.1 initiation factor 2 subunit family protein [Cryptosporidium muris RN66]|eukprot:XP_002141516.1 initiation factor 2 subunit family protein [Cryptosporidium muris RN66]